MISGAHSVIYSQDPEADRAFFRDVLELPAVDAGGGWLIFGLPPSEVAVHPSPDQQSHELYLLSDDIGSFVSAVGAHGVECSAIEEQRWGSITRLTLPGGGRIGVYQPKHARPPNP